LLGGADAGKPKIKSKLKSLRREAFIGIRLAARREAPFSEGF